jgi:hypothetical protein
MLGGVSSGFGAIFVLIGEYLECMILTLRGLQDTVIDTIENTNNIIQQPRINREKTVNAIEEVSMIRLNYNNLYDVVWRRQGC